MMQWRKGGRNERGGRVGRERKRGRKGDRIEKRTETEQSTLLCVMLASVCQLASHARLQHAGGQRQESVSLGVGILVL